MLYINKLSKINAFRETDTFIISIQINNQYTFFKFLLN